MDEMTLRRALTDSLEEVLEQMFFIDALGEPPAGAEPQLAARLCFCGAMSGRLTLRITAAAARTIAADFLGEEELALSEKQIADVISELANMICGSMLSRVDRGGDFRLESPRPAPAASDYPPSAIVRAVEICGGSLEAIMEMEGPACPLVEELAF